MSELKTLRKASAVAARPPVGNMPFIVSSNGDKANPTTRRLIRSHVMRGKKKKKKEMTAGISPSRGREGNGIGTSTGPVQRDPVNLEELFKTHMPLLPGRLGTRLYYLDFPDDIDSSVIMQMIQESVRIDSNMPQVSKVAMKIVSPLLASIGFHDEGGVSRHPVGFDAAALHINAYALENFIDRILRRRPDATVNSEAAQHHQRGLQLLRQKLLGDDEEERISDATVSAVLKLASASHFDGDVATSKQHIQGLRKMVDLRGGLDAFNHHPRLRTEMLRCDLGIALLTDSKPEFFLQPSEPIPEYPAQLSSKPITKLRPEQGLNFISMLDEDLAEAWRTTRSFCLLANLGTQTRMLLPPETIHGTMTAVMYRLFHMGFASGSFNETVRLGLLVSTYHIFLQWQDIRPPSHGISASYHQSLRRHMSDGGLVPSKTMVWLLTVGAVSLFNIFEDDWLRDSLREHLDICQVRTWKELQEILKSQLWIQQLDDKSGKHVYDSLSGSLNPQVDKEEVRMWLEEVIETPTEQAQQ
ncbi:hypothetical protein PG996_011552 [Apiospora saccharicola]|uniref:Uncharacterized protein n=1 Tax=Apiospora saccharicola TaxID=335842 RepID=A0ABR1UFD9_9PEZI